MKQWRRLWRADSGQTSVEFALILGLVVVVLAVLVMDLLGRVDPLVESYINHLVFRIKGLPNNPVGAFSHF